MSAAQLVDTRPHPPLGAGLWGLTFPDPTPRIVCEMEESLVPSPPPGPVELCVGDCSADFRTQSEQLYTFVVGGVHTRFLSHRFLGVVCSLAPTASPCPLGSLLLDAYFRPCESQSGPGLRGHAAHHLWKGSGCRQQGHGDRERWRVPVHQVGCLGAGASGRQMAGSPGPPSPSPHLLMQEGC